MTMEFKRHVLPEDKAKPTAAQLQKNLIALIDLSLVLKQAHWNVVGKNFRAVHLQLDEILVTTREGTDDFAERIVMIGFSPDGRSCTVAKETPLAEYATGFVNVDDTVQAVADALQTTIGVLRESIDALDDLDLISQDMVIAVSSELEKHLWMVQAQEL
ncbi:DNA starvation/stationary phase protection protein Dps [Bremerella sp. T1]|uniref:DNA starvation/stationary phase protection protein Dps n=1 Tax=Bremerella sp. TYQ1 TaxID=3119568 RepID=UPI001CCB3666|nr:DNA starvation/stationary phase protection protein Dps [Bremerella volcania]UBM36914.1 DNA starvation/stationary phase protection protein Dps [Bremerella volcania]